MSIKSPPPVLVVGAGPAGLVCALALRKNGIPVRIIEQSTVYHTGTRGAGIMPRSLELFQTLGVFDELQRRRGMVAPPMMMYELQDGKEVTRAMPSLMEKMDPDSSKPFTAMWFISQAILEEVLRDALQKYDCRVELGTSLVDVKQDSNGVECTLSGPGGERKLSVTASFLVGADGAKSTTREWMNASFQSQTTRDNGMLVGNVVVENLGCDRWHTWKRGNHLFSVRPYDEEHKKFVITVTGLSDQDGQEVTAEAFKSLFQTHTGRYDIAFGEFEWLSYFKPKMGLVDKMSEGRIFLAGDSAHVHPPHGGQGLNTSVQDSFNLAWKLALVYQGRSTTSLLDSYNEERLPVITEMLAQVTGLYNKSSTDGSANRSAPARSKDLYMLGINYRKSNIVVDERSGTHSSVETLQSSAYANNDEDVQAGDRAPECSGLRLDGEEQDTSLFGLLTPTKHTVLVFLGDDSDTVQKMLGVLRPYSVVVDVYLVAPKTTSDVSASIASYRTLLDEKGNARTAYKVTTEPLGVVIRPDGIIGAMVYTDEALARYFAAVFKSDQR
ncbi:monooxygenase [Phlebopus sp. FC_14]|nr:monooxygenase [Phlebopus sp. FC_14]